MTRIITHPSNVAELRRHFEKQQRTRSPFGILGALSRGVEIQESEHMEKDRPTGKYILPDGRVVENQDVVVDTPFVTYGPEDIPSLLYAGMIQEEREALYYMLSDSWWLHLDLLLAVRNPAVLLSSACC